MAEQARIVEEKSREASNPPPGFDGEPNYGLAETVLRANQEALAATYELFLVREPPSDLKEEIHTLETINADTVVASEAAALEDAVASVNAAAEQRCDVIVDVGPLVGSQG